MSSSMCDRGLDGGVVELVERHCGTQRVCMYR